MTLNVHLPDNQEAALRARAQSHGVTTEEYVQQVLARELDRDAGVAEPFWKTFSAEIEALPDEVFENLPADSATEHDHYLYGSPKSQS